MFVVASPSFNGAHVVPPFDDARIIAGQGTVAQEIIGQCREQGFTPDLLVAPVGGGGLLAGVGLAVSAMAPEIKVLGAEPAGADDAQRSFRSGQRITEQHPQTIADGLRTTLGGRNFTVIRNTVNDVVTVSEAQIIDAPIGGLKGCDDCCKYTLKSRFLVFH